MIEKKRAMGKEIERIEEWKRRKWEEEGIEIGAPRRMPGGQLYYPELDPEEEEAYPSAPSGLDEATLRRRRRPPGRARGRQYAMGPTILQVIIKDSRVKTIAQFGQRVEIGVA